MTQGVAHKLIEVMQNGDTYTNILASIQNNLNVYYHSSKILELGFQCGFYTNQWTNLGFCNPVLTQFSDLHG